jgi:CDP-2,3-bis-(O-geranylgeranyl)-sn-glycerol synthase
MNSSFEFVLSTLYFFLPAYFCNMTPPLLKKAKIFEFLAKPIDFNKKFFDNLPILGSHKTFRGAIFGILIGMSVVFFQYFLYRFPFFKKISILDYQEINILFLGFLISFSAVLGDLFFAFIKRRLKLKPGVPFLPFDQTNYVISSALIVGPVYKIKISIWVTLFFLTFFLHIIFNRLAYYLKIHQAKW